MSRKRLNLIGQKFGRLTVIKFSHIDKWGSSCWHCKCDCGNFIIIPSTHLKSNHTESCGCLNREKITKHKMAKTRFYHIWQKIKDRCFNENNLRFSDYGGRGITVCKRWLKFENFRDDMHKSYKEHCEKYNERNTTIDRKNNNGNYELKNCRWASIKQQNLNKRNNRLITYEGQTLTMSQWEQKLNFKETTIHIRINRLKWSISKTLTTPIKKYKKRKL